MRVETDLKSARYIAHRPSRTVASLARELGLKRRSDQSIAFPMYERVRAELELASEAKLPWLQGETSTRCLDYSITLHQLRLEQAANVDTHLNNAAARYRYSGAVRGLLANDVGCGKTLEAIQLLLHIQPKRCLVVCPLSARQTWRREFAKWGGAHLTKRDDAEDLWTTSWGGFVACRHYEFLQKHSTQLPTPDMLIVDEAHRLANRKKYTDRVTAELRDGAKIPLSERTLSQAQCVVELSSRARHVVLMSATPARNHAWNVWGLLRCLDPALYSSFWSFVRCYWPVMPNAYDGWDITDEEPRFQEQLQAELDQWVTRSTRSQVFPGLGYTVQVVEAEMPPRLMALYDERLDAPYHEHFENPLTKLLWLRQFTIHPGLVGVAAPPECGKLGRALQLLDDQEEQHVVFNHYNAALVRAGVPMDARITGEVVDLDRQAAQDRFHEDAIHNLWVHPIAGGESIDLSCADIAIFTDLDGSPTTFEQCLGRVVRPGRLERDQPPNALIQVLEVPGTHDQYMREMCIDKTRGMVNLMTDDGALTMFRQLRQERKERRG